MSGAFALTQPKEDMTMMKNFILEIDNEPNIRFIGEIVASVANSDNPAMGSAYSGQTGCWTELALYKTKGGNFICHQIERTRWENDNDHFLGKVCKSPAEVKEFFGSTRLAKELYDEANIDISVYVE